LIEENLYAVMKHMTSNWGVLTQVYH